MRVEAGERIPYAGCMVAVREDGKAYLVSEKDREVARRMDAIEREKEKNASP